MSDVSLFDLTGKKALVTGGAMGIGRACAEIMAKAGADIAIADVNEEVGQKTVAKLQSFGVKSLFIHCDITDKTQVQAMVATVAETMGRLDIAVNSAGISICGKDEEFPQQDWEKVMGVNLTGTWLCAQAQAQQMIKQTPTEGKIINIASICATMNINGAGSAYDASKAAVVHMSRSLALQWGRFNINVNSISPSHVMTPMYVRTPIEERKRVREITPMGHIQRPEDLQGPVLFLASKASDYYTGQNMIVDGGHTLSTWLHPLTRDIPPRISEAEELVEVKKDFDAIGIDYDEHGLPLN